MEVVDIAVVGIALCISTHSMMTLQLSQDQIPQPSATKRRCPAMTWTLSVSLIFTSITGTASPVDRLLSPFLNLSQPVLESVALLVKTHALVFHSCIESS